MVDVQIAVSLSAATWALPRLGKPPEVVAVAWNYLLLLAYSIPFAFVSIALDQAAKAVNHACSVLEIMAGAA